MNHFGLSCYERAEHNNKRKTKNRGWALFALFLLAGVLQSL